jgi:hypothetical protein
VLGAFSVGLATRVCRDIAGKLFQSPGHFRSANLQIGRKWLEAGKGLAALDGLARKVPSALS